MDKRTTVRKSTGAKSDEEVADTSSSGYNDGISLLSYIIGGILVWSLIGWLLDNALNTQWIALVGALVGAAGGLYLSHVHNLTRSADPNSSAPRQDSENELGRS